jgi:hypothetical protein
MICYNSVLSSPLPDNMVGMKSGMWAPCALSYHASITWPPLLPTFASRYTPHHTTFKLQHLTFGPEALSWYSAEFRPKAPQAHCVECHAVRDSKVSFHGNGGRKEKGTQYTHS